MISTTSWKFAIALAAILWGVVLVINWLGPGEVLVSINQVESLEQSGHIEKIIRYPDKLVVHLREALFVRIAEGDMYTDIVYIPRDAESLAFEQRSIEDNIASAEMAVLTSWVGEYTIFFFIFLGVIFLGIQIRHDRRFGSVRRQIAELDTAYRAGAIEEAVYQEKLEDLLPKL